MTGDPNRLLHDPTTAAILRRDLGVASSGGEGVVYDVAAGLSRFESALAADMANLSHGTGASATASGSGGLAVGALLLAGGLAAVLGWQLAGEPSPASAPRGDRAVQVAAIAPSIVPSMVAAPPRVVAEPPAASPIDPPIEAEMVEMVELAADEPMAEANAPAARTPRSRRVRSVRSEAPVAAPSDYLREARELNSARGFLGREPARALTLAEAGAASYRDGAFAQEWEGVAVLALFELQRVDEARSRAASFLQRHPNGTYAPRIRQALQRPGPE